MWLSPLFNQSEVEQVSNELSWQISERSAYLCIELQNKLFQVNITIRNNICEHCCRIWNLNAKWKNTKYLRVYEFFWMSNNFNDICTVPWKHRYSCVNLIKTKRKTFMRWSGDDDIRRWFPIISYSYQVTYISYHQKQCIDICFVICVRKQTHPKIRNLCLDIAGYLWFSCVKNFLLERRNGP